MSARQKEIEGAQKYGCMYDFACAPDTCLDPDCPDKGNYSPRFCEGIVNKGERYCTEHLFMED